MCRLLIILLLNSQMANICLAGITQVALGNFNFLIRITSARFRNGRVK